jgi:Arylsulfatase regulator (Fe-S oxidoreductase)
VDAKAKINQFYQLLCRNGRPGRLGKTFKTENNYYFLDTGTGKVMQVEEITFKVLQALIESENVEGLFELGLTPEELDCSISEIEKVIKEEHILSAYEVKTLIGDAVVNDLHETLTNSVENVTFEVTEKCNLRCKYCVYNPSHPENRGFGYKDMTWDTAKKSIDFLKEHSKDAKHVHIGFYGGEPLLNFKLIKKVVLYALELFNHNVGFGMTTNATLIDKEIACFLIKHHFDLIVSLDGPQELHDKNRITINGEGSFDKTVQGSKMLLEAQKNMKREPEISFNMVISGPNYENDYTKIQEFIESEEWLPKNVMVLTSAVDSGPKESPYFLPQSKEERKLYGSIYEPLEEWEIAYKKEKGETCKTLFSDSVFDKNMMVIHKRLLSDTPVKNYGMNGCCVPGQRRIYVTVDGDFRLCERVGLIPSIGNIDEGFNIEIIERLYTRDFIEEAQKYCKECWAINLCTLCYVNCYDEVKTHFAYRHNSCRSERSYLENSLIRYHMIMEHDPESLSQYNERELT